MSDRELKSVLMDSLTMEKELFEFCIECLTKIYGEHTEKAIALFKEGVDGIDYCGCIQSLRCIDSQLNKQLENMKAYKDTQA